MGGWRCSRSGLLVVRREGVRRIPEVVFQGTASSSRVPVKGRSKVVADDLE